MLHTKCLDCIHAQWKNCSELTDEQKLVLNVDERQEKVQVGCDKGVIEKLIKKGSDSLIEVRSEDSAFYVIEKRICKEYVDKNNPKQKSRGGLIFNAIVLAENASIPEIMRTIESVENQEYQPHTVWVVISDKRKDQSELIKQLQNSKLSNWFVKLKKGESNNGKKIDSVVKDLEFGYYSVFNAGFSLHANFFSKIEQYYNDDLEDFFVLLPNKCGEGLTVDTFMHNYVQGYSLVEDVDTGENIVDVVQKITIVCKKNGHTELVKDSQEVFGVK